jgi:DHA1 family tetracycline resistance protein-like MFS transporter
MAYFVSSASILASITFIPIYSQELGLDNTFITLIVALYSSFVFLGSAIGGRASDRFSRKLIILIGLLTSAVTFSGIFIVKDDLSFLIVRITAGFSAGLAPPALIALAYEKKQTGMGVFSSFGSLGWGFGTIIAGWVALFQTGYVFLTSGLFFFIAFLIALFLTEKETPLKFSKDPSTLDKKDQSTLRVFIKNFPIYFPMFLRHSAAMAVWTLWPLWLKDVLLFDTVQIGFVQAANAITQFFIMGLFTDKLNSDFSFELGLFMSAITFVTFLMTDIFLLFLITQVLLGFSWANAFVGAIKQVTEKNPEARGTASGLLTGTISIAGLAGPIYTFIFLLFFPEPDIYYILIVFAALMSFTAFLTHVVYRVMSKEKIHSFTI